MAWLIYRSGVRRGRRRRLRFGPWSTVLAPSVAGRLLRRVRHPTPIALSAREIEVLTHVATGKTKAEIGRALHISETTVKTHLPRIFAKLDVSDRTAAVTTAMAHGLLQH